MPKQTPETCSDFQCEWTIDVGDHSHVGVQPYLRRVMVDGKVVDGKEIWEARQKKKQH